MKFLLTMFAAIASVMSTDVAHASQHTNQVVVAGRVNNPGFHDRIENESLADLINRIGGITASRAEQERYRRGEPILGVSIELYRNGKKIEFKIDPKSNKLWEFPSMKDDTIIVTGTRSIEAAVGLSVIILKKPNKS